MCYSYILFSETLDRYYVGHTCDTLASRVKKHLQGHGGYTSKAKDWILVWHEAFEGKSEAYAREREIKSWKSRKRIEELISDY